MKFCKNCGKEIQEGVKFCNNCGSPINFVEKNAEDTVVNETENTDVSEQVETVGSTNGGVEQESAENNTTEVTKVKKQFKITKKIIGIAAAALVVVIIAIISIISVVKTNNYKKTLALVYNSMSNGAEYAEQYCSLQEKVWRNCIWETESIETDEYTQDDYGSFYDDFNDAIQEFYDGEKSNYYTVSFNVSAVNVNMEKLKNCPKKLEDEYTAIKQMYVSYSKLTDLVVGSSTYSLNEFSNVLESAKSDFKSAQSAAGLLID